MKRSLLALFLAATLLSGCGIFGSNEKDETVGWSAQKLYSEAKDAMEAKSYEKAIKYLEKLEARYPYGRYAQQAQIDVAYAYWKDGQRASAIAACDRFIKLYPNHANVDYAYYLKGLVNFNEPQGIMTIIDSPDMTERDSKGSRESFESFKELVTRFPDSKYAPDSRARMLYLVNSLAQSEVNVARFYMKRGAYVAALARCDYALKSYPNAQAIEEAVYIKVKAYDLLGMTDLRDNNDRVMRKNFPESKYLTGKADRSAPWWKLWDPDW